MVPPPDDNPLLQRNIQYFARYFPDIVKDELRTLIDGMNARIVAKFAELGKGGD